MPIVPETLQGRTARFVGQRWLLDAVINLIGPEWDQGRLHYWAEMCSRDHSGPILGLKAMIKKYDDMTRELTALARRFELRAKQGLKEGHPITASDDFFAAAILYCAAQWPIFENTALNLALEKKKVECYLGYARLADHKIEPVEIPYRGRSLKGYFHLPPGHTGGRLPALLMINGMDGTKETSMAASADRFLRRGFACLCLDVPGQGSSLTGEVWYDPDTFGEVGTASYEWLAARPEVDAAKVMAMGVSFGSYWATQAVAAEPRFAACAVTFTCFQPGAAPLFEMASPTFKQRLMYMTGSADEAALDALAPKLDVREISAKIRMPYLVVAGEDDELSDIGSTFEHLNHVPGPKTLLLYAGDLHGLNHARSSQMGPPGMGYLSDWLRDRSDGKPPESEYVLVDSRGQVHRSPWGERRTYEYGAPLDLQTLFDDDVATGLA